jgi:hypothetical protein
VPIARENPKVGSTLAVGLRFFVATYRLSERVALRLEYVTAPFGDIKGSMDLSAPSFRDN